ncbi:MAG TPA: hypothetical protein VFX76_20720, partial [Roseiflexaceae bacterium]|nr:hypothetical protein [Roseiflexaceae bacterium]
MIKHNNLATTLVLDLPFSLPFCSYPTAADVDQHGVQPLPATLPLVDFRGASLHRSKNYSAVPVSTLTHAQV